ncbi:Phage integrase [Labilithrix luteola]|uniref:Phage integrase n=1 Tax=Labilithrix luteola TaxID=1391654 RepID=A0A0K1PQ09_9BACT|nr:tyrosine-type recombinase/integrase [Labilithrix luteola]AKU95607.1 Phage integrase [Labilithrix luteola]
MTKKNAAKVAARARQTRFGGTYLHHRHVAGGGTNDATRKVEVADLSDEAGSFLHALKRDDLSPNTVASYGAALRQLAEFLADRGYPTDVRRIDPRSIDEWIIDLVECQKKPAVAHSRFRVAQRFFRWYAETDDSFASPMRGMRPPPLPEYRRVLELEQQSDLVRTCQGRTFEDRRDLALLRVFFTTGARRAEVANLRYSPTGPADLDLKRRTVRVVDKGRGERTVSLDDDTVAALHEYLRARRDHAHADLPWLWLGKKGHLDDPAVGRALRDRGKRAGISDLHRLGHGLWIVEAGG